MKRIPLTWIDDRYEVSSDGCVWSFADSHGGRKKRAKRLGVNVSSSGYAQVRLPFEGVFKWFAVHRLVLTAFSGRTGLQVNHRNGERLDNKLRNLEWSDASKNAAHAYRVLGRTHPKPSLGKFGRKNPLSKPVEQLSIGGKRVKVWGAAQDAARAGFSASNISGVCRGERKTHAGFVWRFQEGSK